MSKEFIDSFKEMTERVYVCAEDHGFWDEVDPAKGPDNTKIAETALCHSELSEALEAIRASNPPDDRIPEFSGAEAELADCIIRIMDLSQAKGWDVGGAILAKHAFNLNRPYKHGKQF